MDGIARELLWVDLAYRGVESGYVAEFIVQQGDGKGEPALDGFYVERQVFKMA